MSDTLKALSAPTCRKCGGAMSPGKAIAQTITGIGDFHDADAVVSVSPGGPGALIGCMKCEDCGWSVTGNEELSAPTFSELKELT